MLRERLSRPPVSGRGHSCSVGFLLVELASQTPTDDPGSEYQALIGALVDRLTSVPTTDDGRFTSVTTVDLEHAGTAARSYGIEDVPVDAGWDV